MFSDIFISKSPKRCFKMKNLIYDVEGVAPLSNQFQQLENKINVNKLVICYNKIPQEMYKL